LVFVVVVVEVLPGEGGVEVFLCGGERAIKADVAADRSAEGEL
jgi:hypothetical protein